MSERVVAVQRRGQQYVAVVFTSGGIYHSSLPRGSEKEALRAVNASELPISDNPEHLKICDLIFDAMDGKTINERSLMFDFSDLTEKEVKILKTLLNVPAGKTITYGELANAAGLPRAARFAGNVMAKNRFAPLIPCHRVIASDGLGGYGLGLEMKARLLRKEGAIN